MDTFMNLYNPYLASRKFTYGGLNRKEKQTRRTIVPKQVTEAQIREYLHTLSDAPQRIFACTQGLDELRLKTPPASKEWSAAEIMGHVRGAAEVWTRSIHDMITRDSPQLTYVAPRDWVKKQQYMKLSFAENLEAYRAERENLMRVLQGLTLAQWNRSATFVGKFNTFTVFGEVRRMALHDLDHCDQLEAMFLSDKHE